MGVGNGGGDGGRVPAVKRIEGDVPPDLRMKWPKYGVFFLFLEYFGGRLVILSTIRPPPPPTKKSVATLLHDANRRPCYNSRLISKLR